ncbi:fimbria/pilus outer membrane usher protein [Aeromonas dhakensis]|uniref:fimbria/pilus outer membrane usher protein n=1 Tax=Aeromonas dhakensis TaxID=196024 RepID=UPI003986BF6A
MLNFFLIVAFLSLSLVVKAANNVDSSNVTFNTDLLDAKNKQLVEVGAFNAPGFMSPGVYSMKVVVNGAHTGEHTVVFYEGEEKDISRLCLTTELAEEFNLTAPSMARVLGSTAHTLENGEICYDPDALDGVTIKAELNKDTLSIVIPQAYRNYVDKNWDPPSRWDEGVSGALLDYNISLQERREHDEHTSNVSGYGVAGINTGAWRWRADWQGSYQRGAGASAQHELGIQRLYAHRAVPILGAKLQLGEQSFASDLFDGFSFIGGALLSDDKMLPPNLRGYAPEVVGIAQSNAKVVISQSGRVVYEAQVPAGPFRIQDLGSAIVGVLDVVVEEQDGSVQRFQVNTANIPYLSRPGSVRYKIGAGKVSTARRQMDGPGVVSGEFSWGVSNGWSLLGGGLVSADFHSLSLGVGRDLLQFGAFSFDASQSHAQLDAGNKRGGSYRINYSKRFEQFDSEINFAGYRFSDRDFMSINDFLSAQQLGQPYSGGAKQAYTISASKQMRPLALSARVDFNHLSYWSQEGRDRLSFSLSHTFELFGQRNMSVSLSAYRSEQGSLSDEGMYLSLSVPLGGDKRMSYSVSSSDGQIRHGIGVSDRLNERASYSLNAYRGPANEGISGFYNYAGETATIAANVSHQSGSATSVGATIRSGVTLTDAGVAMHRIGGMGATRIMVDTDGASNVPVQSVGPATLTNGQGVAVVTGTSSYQRVRTSIDVNRLGEEIEPIGSPILMGTLTEGAIGYRRFDMLVGSKRMVVLQHQDGSGLPFAAEVFNEKNVPLGMVGDEGMAYLAGLQENSKLIVSLGNNRQCQATVPSPLPAPEQISTLVCH